jgi:SAM-dependent methyltransferase
MPCDSAAVRRYELEILREWFPPGVSVLEIGGGSGFQASLLDSWGCDVASIDLADGAIPAVTFDVQPYDGRTLPFPAGTFQRVFSSNVLEHVDDLERMHAEIRRVLAPDGIALHLMPSTSWRLWSSVAHYLYLVRLAAALVRGRRTVTTAFTEPPTTSEVLAKRGALQTARRVLVPAPHGEYRSASAELYFYSRRRWLREFRRHGFEAISVRGSDLFYAGWGVMPLLEMRHRRSLSRWLGSACNVFVLRAL